MYEVRVNCTTRETFSFQGQKVTPNIVRVIEQKIGPDTFDGLHSIYLLKKKRTVPEFIQDNSNQKFKITSLSLLEFLWARQLTEKEFVDVIQRLKETGFASSKKSEIQLVDTPNGDIIYTYYFNSCQPKKITQNKKVHKYSYQQFFIFKRL